MGVDLSTYRARIGCFRNPAFDPLGCWQSCLLVWMAISQLMLKLAGDVEENPGPKRGHSKKKPKDRKEKTPSPSSVKPSQTESSTLRDAQADAQHNEYTESLTSVDPQRQTNISSDLASWSADDVLDWIKKIGIKDEHIEALREVEIDGELLKSYTVETLKDDLAEVGHRIPPGPVRKIINARDSMLGEHQVTIVPDSQGEGASNAMSPQSSHGEHVKTPLVVRPKQRTGSQVPINLQMQPRQTEEDNDMIGHKHNTKAPIKKIFENFRQFDDKDEPRCNYYSGRFFPTGESGADASNVCHEYKQFTEAAKQEQPKKKMKYLNEAVRFACGCLNERTYGTIHFGVADDGKILGFNVAESEKQLYCDWLRDGIEKMFAVSLNQREAAIHCIRRPKFVPVITTASQKGSPKFVMEVDIVPSSEYCKDVMFKVALLSENGEKGAIAYRRSKAATQSLDQKQEKEFLTRTLPGNVESLKKREQNQSSIVHPGQSLDKAEEFKRLLCVGEKTLEGSVHRILVSNGPEPPRPSFDEFKDLYDFVVDIPFTAVFDFDAESTTNGLYKVYDSVITEREDSTSNVRILEPDSFTNRNIAMTSLDFFNHTKFPQEVCWIMSNGWLDPLTYKLEDPMDLQQWTKTRGRGINEAVIKYTDPGINQEGRVLIVFCLLSKSQIGVIAELFHSFCMRVGLDSLMVLTPDEQNLEALLNALLDKYKTDDILRRAVSMPPKHMGLVVSQLKGKTYGKQCFVNCSTGTKAPLDFSTMKSMKDLEVLSVTQCSYTVTELKKDRNALKELQTESELRFYRGSKVDWWNFYFKQVAERDAYKDLRRYINMVSSRSGKQGKKISVIAVQHEPGAGGSTLARNALWDFRETCRCVIIKKCQPDRDTARQLMNLHAYLENDPHKCLPILALVEDVDEDAFYDFLSALHGVFDSKDTIQLACIVIYCGQAKLASQQKFPKKLHPVYLELKLSVDEQVWFQTKFEQLENKEVPESSLEDMLSFNLFKEGFDEDYIQRTVSNYLELVTPKERELICYISLLNFFLVGTSCSNTLPVNLCDTFMAVGPQWEQKLSKAAHILLMKEQYSKGSIGAYKVKHPKIAEETLNHCLAIKGGPTLSEMTENFLKCEIFQERWFTVKDLVEMTDQMFKYRSWKRRSEQPEQTNKKKPQVALGVADRDDGEEDRGWERFSALVTRIITYENCEAAVRVLQLWHKVKKQVLQRLYPDGYHDDPMIFQQIARIYMYAGEYKDAHQWIDEALSLCFKENSYLLDTKGHIYKAEFVVKIQEDNYDPQSVTDVAFKAIDIFRSAQNVNKTETTGFNTAPYFGELFMSFKLFGLVYDSTSRDQDMLRKFLLTGHDPPNFVLEVWGPYTEQMRCQVLNIRNTMDYLSEIQTIYKKEDAEMATFDSEFRKLRLAKRQLQNYVEQYIKYFGEDDDTPPSYIRDPADICSWRRRKVISKNGNNFREVFEMAKDQKFGDLHEIRMLLGQNEPKTCFDLQHLIAVILALSWYESPEQAVRSHKEVFRLSEEFVQDQHHDHDISRMKAFFYVTMLMWPRKGMLIEFNLPLFERYLGKLSELGKSPLYYRRNRHGEDSGRDSGFQPAKKVYFYLGKGQGLHAFIHVTHVSGHRARGHVAHHRARGMFGHFWESSQAKKLLRRVNGRLVAYDTIHAVNPFNPNKPIELRLARPESERYVGRKLVNFILGFSWSGPLAFNVLDGHVQEEASEVTESEEEASSASGGSDSASVMVPSNYPGVQRRPFLYSDIHRTQGTRRPMPTHSQATGTPTQQNTATRRIKCPQCPHIWHVKAHFTYFYCQNPDCNTKIIIS